MSLNLNNLTARLTTGFLNTQDDPSPGLSALGTTATSQQFLGQLGQKLQLNNAAALQLSYTATGTLYSGTYQYVRFKAGSAPAKGTAVYWDDLDNFVVTTVAPTGQPGFAGVCIMSNTAGNYGWIQTDGKATALFGTVTKAGAAIGDLVVLTSAANTFDVLADATTLTSPIASRIAGQAIEAPVTSQLKLVYLTGAKPVN